MYHAILFDLDGTLVDSKRDLATGVNRMRMELGLSKLPVPDVVRNIGWGARNLVAKSILPGRSNPDDPPPSEIDDALAIFRKHYDDCLLDTTQPYPGIVELLRTGLHLGVPMAVVSNKPEGFCRKILAGLGLTDPFSLVVGGDTCPEKKPSPEPLLLALEGMGAPPTEGVMVGDSETDLNAARSAGCKAIIVTWGLRPREQLLGLGADEVADTVQQLHGSLFT